MLLKIQSLAAMAGKRFPVHVGSKGNINIRQTDGIEVDKFRIIDTAKFFLLHNFMQVGVNIFIPQFSSLKHSAERLRSMLHCGPLITDDFVCFASYGKIIFKSGHMAVKGSC